jgi:dipeptide transport system ATP-binding protein
MTAPILETRHIFRDYHVGGGFGARRIVHAVRDVSFKVDKGRTLAIVGESGSGKSTLARILTLIDPPTSGELYIEGERVDITRAGVSKALRRKVQMVFQNPYGSLNPRKRIGAILEEPLVINTDLSKAQRRAEALDMMARVGLRSEQYARYPHMFSGGQRQRVAIARALMLRPKLLVADEPVSALDMSVQAQVLNLLVDLQRDMGLAYLFISHDLGVVRHIAHDVMIMYLGIAVEHGSKERIFARALHPYTQALLAATPGMGRARRRIVPKGELPSPLDPPQGCVFSTRCPYVTERCRSERPTLRPLDGRLVACHYAERFVETQAA